MKKLMVVLCLAALLVSGVGADTGTDGGRGNTFESVGDGDGLFAGVKGTELSEKEMAEVEGSLEIFGTKISTYLRSCFIDYSQTPSYQSKPHCDILAFNTVSTLGFSPLDQLGRFFNCNYLSVSQIYQRFPNNRYYTPPINTTGYIFSDYGYGKQHMQAYSRGNGNTYTRYWNNSYQGFTSTVNYNWRPKTRPTLDVFVPLPSQKPIYFW